MRARPRCPLWGKCRDSGKGGGVGIFELFPFNEPHPLSQPCRFRSAVKSASSPIGEPRWLVRIRPSLYKNIGACRETPQSALTGCQLPFQGRFWGAYPTFPERGGGPRVSVAEGFAVRRIPIGMHQGESVQTPLGFPRGEAGRLDGSSEPARLTEEGWRQPKYCLHFVRWYQPQIIADYFPLFSFIYNMEKVFIKQATFSTHRTLHENFGARHPSSVFFVNRFRSADCQKIQLPPGGSQGDCTYSPGVL